MTTSPPKLLVVDDTPTVREAVSGLAENLGYVAVAEAADGRDAVHALLAHEPDVVVMDWRMPHVDGVTATRALTATAPDVSVVAFTAADSCDIAEAFYRAGAVAYVDKGDLDGLVAELTRLCDAVRHRKQPR